MNSIFKIKLWVGIGFGIMPVKYKDVYEEWIVILFVRMRIRKILIAHGY